MADYQPPSIFPKTENSIFTFSAEKSLVPKPILPVRPSRSKSPKKRMPEPVILDERGDFPGLSSFCQNALRRVKESCPQIANGQVEATKSEGSKDEVSKTRAGEGEGEASKDEAGESKTGESEVSKDEAGGDEASKDESSKDKASEGESVESKKVNDWIIELPEDGLEEMILMLEIIHGHFDRVPFSLSVRRLHDLLVLCNKYDVLSLLRPWSWHWLSAMRSTLDEPYVLWVAWEMGDVLLFRDMLVRITEGVPISALKNPNLMGVQYGKQRMHWAPQSDQINEFPMIPLDCIQNMSADDLSDLISLTRLMLIEAAVKPYRTILSQMKSKTHSSNQNAIKNNCVKNCIPSGVDELTNALSVMTAAIKCIAPLSKDQQAHLEKRAFQLGLRVEDVVDKGAMHIWYGSNH
ncbi:hypothetical protein CSIM01_03483 [Colletotrichum simmondsii]|uniref:Uncharacterized protein n=1 Tax=Colletotrichum simmondsii TaxID=703756 RepID=A0A135RYT5_9PEZI|nr:hypothetical protein CSIM01_03483 [Colletotrichum simmondsii]